MVAPAAAAIIAAAIAAGAKAGGDYMSARAQKKAANRRAREMKRETHSDLLKNALQRNAELEAQRLASSQKISKRKSQSMQDTSNLLREAFNI